MKRFWKDVSVGDYVTPVNKPLITKQQISFFSAAINEFSPLQLDDDYARNVGFNSVFSSNLFGLSTASEVLYNFAKNISIISLSGTFHKLIWPGDRLIAKGLIVQRYQVEDEYRVGLNIWCENQLGEVVMKGTSDILMFKDDQHEKKSSLKTPSISSKTHDALVEKYLNKSQKEKSKSTVFVG